jgi:CRISPR-associated protein Csx14
MIMPTPDISIDVDLRNPGQFLACCGLLELANRLWPGSEGWFVTKERLATFRVATYSDCSDPLGEIVRKLCEPDEIVKVVKDQGITQADRQPVILLPFELRLDWWLDSYGDGDKSELKIWAGRQTPAGNINKLRDAWRVCFSRTGSDDSAGLLSHRQPVSGRFGFDPSASWESLDVGFSPDEQGMLVQTSPAAEILAAIGLQRCRPKPVGNKRRWFWYRPWHTPIDIIVAPAVMVDALQPSLLYEFPVAMRNQQYGSFGWAQPSPTTENER